MLDWITRCVCGAELEFPCDPRDQDDTYRTHCDACNRRFEEAMQVEAPFGWCPSCGCRYHEYTIPCGRCGELGEVLVEPHDVLNPQWCNCPNCGGTGSVTIVDGLHEETICGLREYPDGPLPTHADILASAAYIAESNARWAERLKAYPDDVPF